MGHWGVDGSIRHRLRFGTSILIMRTIPLGKTGLVALVDDADFEVLSRHTWTPQHHGRTVYAVESFGCCGGAGRRMHRMIADAPAGVQVDHRDGDGLNNTRANLRLASGRENQGNRRKQQSTSRFKGVTRRKPTHAWRAAIRDNGVLVALGTFASEEDAARAYDAAARRIFGGFAALNFPILGERSAHSPTQDSPEAA
jgi:hypothetical protein